MMASTYLRRCVIPVLLGFGLVGQGAAQEGALLERAGQTQEDVHLSSSISSEVIIARDVVVNEVTDEALPDRRAIPVRPGYPLPSVIVGHIDSGQLAPDRAPLDHDQRRQLKQQDPEDFALRLAAGDFDPVPDRIVEAIQTELSRMSCYGGRIDGLWGAATAEGVQRYFAKAEESAVSNSAQLALFHQIVAGPEVICDPLPVVPALSVGTRRAPAPTRSGTAPAAGTTPPRAQPSQDQRQPTILPGFVGTGLFR